MESGISFSLIALLVVAIFSVAPLGAYSQEDAGMLQTTSNGTLDIRLEQLWDEGSQVRFHVSFIDPDTGEIHEHQDYDFRILQDGQQVFSAARDTTGQAILHNVEGTLTIPYTFEETGDYTIQVYLASTGLPPVPTDEEATFPLTVVPEFPASVLAAGMAALMTTTVIVLSQRFKIFS